MKDVSLHSLQRHTASFFIIHRGLLFIDEARFKNDDIIEMFKNNILIKCDMTLA